MQYELTRVQDVRRNNTSLSRSQIQNAIHTLLQGCIVEKDAEERSTAVELVQWLMSLTPVETVCKGLYDVLYPRKNSTVPTILAYFTVQELVGRIAPVCKRMNRLTCLLWMNELDVDQPFLYVGMQWGKLVSIMDMDHQHEEYSQFVVGAPLAQDRTVAAADLCRIDNPKYRSDTYNHTLVFPHDGQLNTQITVGTAFEALYNALVYKDPIVWTYNPTYCIWLRSSAQKVYTGQNSQSIVEMFGQFVKLSLYLGTLRVPSQVTNVQISIQHDLKYEFKTLWSGFERGSLDMTAELARSDHFTHRKRWYGHVVLTVYHKICKTHREDPDTERKAVHYYLVTRRIRQDASAIVSKEDVAACLGMTWDKWILTDDNVFLLLLAYGLGFVKGHPKLDPLGVVELMCLMNVISEPLYDAQEDGHGVRRRFNNFIWMVNRFHQPGFRSAFKFWNERPPSEGFSLTIWNWVDPVYNSAVHFTSSAFQSFAEARGGARALMYDPLHIRYFQPGGNNPCGINIEFNDTIRLYETFGAVDANAICDLFDCRNFHARYPRAVFAQFNLVIHKVLENMGLTLLRLNKDTRPPPADDTIVFNLTNPGSLSMGRCLGGMGRCLGELHIYVYDEIIRMRVHDTNWREPLANLYTRAFQAGGSVVKQLQDDWHFSFYREWIRKGWTWDEAHLYPLDHTWVDNFAEGAHLRGMHAAGNRMVLSTVRSALSLVETYGRHADVHVSCDDIRLWTQHELLQPVINPIWNNRHTVGALVVLFPTWLLCLRNGSNILPNMNFYAITTSNKVHDDTIRMMQRGSGPATFFKALWKLFDVGFDSNAKKYYKQISQWLGPGFCQDGIKMDSRTGDCKTNGVSSMEDPSLETDGFPEKTDGFPKETDGFPEETDGFPKETDGFPEDIKTTSNVKKHPNAIAYFVQLMTTDGARRRLTILDECMFHGQVERWSEFALAYCMLKDFYNDNGLRSEWRHENGAWFSSTEMVACNFHRIRTENTDNRLEWDWDEMIHSRLEYDQWCKNNPKQSIPTTSRMGDTITSRGDTSRQTILNADQMRLSLQSKYCIHPTDVTRDWDRIPEWTAEEYRRFPWMTPIALAKAEPKNRVPFEKLINLPSTTTVKKRKRLSNTQLLVPLMDELESLYDDIVG